jgi:hypothetical protein
MPIWKNCVRRKGTSHRLLKSLLICNPQTISIMTGRKLIPSSTSEQPSRHFTVLSAKCSQYPKVVFKVFGGASIGFASHKTTAQKADINQMYHPAFYNV